jgi:IS605 OrfB family transposase
VILSTKTTTKFANKQKRVNLQLFIQEYKQVCQFFVDELWNLDKIPTLPPKEITNKAQTWLSKRATQCAAKQASGIVRGAKQKQKQRWYVYHKLLHDNLLHQARRLKKVIDKTIITKADLKVTEPELDSRFVKVNLENKTSFDGWITFTCLGNKLKVFVPFKKSQHFNEMLKLGKIKTGVRLSNKFLTFTFDIPDVPLKSVGTIIGLDVGIKNVFTTSDNQRSVQDKHGWDLTKIQQRLSRKRKGSQGFAKAQAHRKNYIHWSLNQLNLENVKHVKLEGIRNLRKGSKSSRWLTHWTYATLFDKLDSLCLRFGVQITKVNPTYTSQRCSQCGWVRKSNRRGKQFRCKACDFTCDADLNAAKNIVLELPAIGRKQRLQHNNRMGFYWHVVSQEFIVPDAKRT